MIKIIAAMSLNRVIGNQGKIPWHIPDDLARFKELTMYSNVIMGRKTYESIGRPLQDRHNFVITSKNIKKPSGGGFTFYTFKTLSQAIRKAKSSTQWIIGGQALYQEALDNFEVNEIYLTVIHQVIEGDTYFPLVDNEVFQIESIEECHCNGYDYSNIKLTRRKVSV